MIDFDAIQERLVTDGLDGWLLYDFNGINPLAPRTLRFPPERHARRRWFYFIPRDGEPIGLVHRLEPWSLEGLPGARVDFLSYDDLTNALQVALRGRRRVAMEYAPNATNPYVSRVDAGTVELVRACGPEVVTSADLIQYFEARWPDAAYPMYRQAARALIDIKTDAFARVDDALRSGKPATEQAIARFIMERMEQAGLEVEAPIVGSGPNASDPHYHTLNAPETPITADTCLLIDLAARVDAPDGTVADFSYMAWTGASPPTEFVRIWETAVTARNAAITRIRESIAAGVRLQGWQVDEAARGVVNGAGYGRYFVHRTGHSIGREVHGAGVHADGLEMRDERELIPGIAFTVEPGIYLRDFGVRTEVNVLIHEDRAEVWEEPMQAELDFLGV